MLTITTLIFDLSEVLIAGLVGIEHALSLRLALPAEDILAEFGGDLLTEICRGQISEEVYLANILERTGWPVTVQELQGIIRENFRVRVAGMEEMVMSLAGRYELVLLSDHAAEWIAAIEPMHPFLSVFRHRFYSFQLQKIKKEPAIFSQVLEVLHKQPEDCLFIDDSPANIASAAEAGIQGIQFIDAAQLTRELRKNGIVVD